MAVKSFALGMAALASASVTNAAPILVGNASFEEQPLPDNASTSAIPVWGNGNNRGYYNPSAAALLGAYDGEHVAFLLTTSFGGGGRQGVLEQQLDTQIVANTRYTLSFLAGSFTFGGVADWTASLVAGDTTLVSRSFTAADFTVPGELRDFDLAFDAATDLVGALTVRFEAFYTPGQQDFRYAAIDNVRLDGTSLGPVETPEPAALGLVGLGMLAIGWRRRSRRAA